MSLVIRDLPAPWVKYVGDDQSLRTNWVHRQLAFGPRPESLNHFNGLLNAGILAIVDVSGWQWGINSPSERKWAEKHALSYHAFPFEDGEYVDPFLLEAIIDRLMVLVMQQKKTVYVHCAAGLSRSPFVVAAFLSYPNDIEAGCEVVKKVNPGVLRCAPFERSYADLVKKEGM